MNIITIFGPNPFQSVNFLRFLEISCYAQWNPMKYDIDTLQFNISIYINHQYIIISYSSLDSIENKLK